MRAFAKHYLVNPYSDEQMEAMVSNARSLFSAIDGLSAPVCEGLIELGILDYKSLAEVPEQVLQIMTGNPESARLVHQTVIKSCP